MVTRRKTPKKNPRIVPMTEAHKTALFAIKNGADVSDYALARLLREVEATKPGYISITKPQMGPYSVREKLPYFGAIASSLGLWWAIS